MSHAKERKEKDCLNCNAVVAGRFCQVCGQENIETGETFRHLATHFISDIFHFDGQFFSTSKYLLFKPGFLTYEYVRGRRASYLNPIKMFVFISAIFFLFFLNLYKPDVNLTKGQKQDYTVADIRAMLQSDLKELDSLKKGNGVSSALLNKQIEKKENETKEALATLQKDSTKKLEIFNRLEGPTFFGGNPYDSKEQYDSVENSLPAKDRDGWLKHKMMLRNIELTERYHENKNELVNGLMETFEHHFPQMLFISLPLFALVLQLLYVRHKNLFYANHLIYTVHFFCAIYVFMFLILLIGKSEALLHWPWLQWISNIIILYGLFYSFRSIQVFYGQRFGKTFVKWLVLNVAAFVILIPLFIALLLFTLAIF